MSKRKKTWTVTHGGIRLRLFRRPRSPFVWAEHRKPDGSRDRFSLGVETNAAAEEVALEHAKRLDRERIVGPELPRESVTFGTLRAQFVTHRGPLLSEKRRAFIQRTLELWAAHLEPHGRPFAMLDFGDHHVESFTARRMDGTLHSEDHRASRKGVRAATIANEIGVLTTVCRWAMRFPTRRKPLLTANPLDGVPVPKEKNPRRPRADQARIRKLLAVAAKVDATGQFEMLLRLAHGTGRRIAAICHLRASDILIGADSVRNGLARVGWDESWAEHWTAAIHWRAEHDKKGQDWIAPMPAALEAELVAYMRKAGAIGEAWLFPYSRRPGEALPNNAANHRLWQAEKAAKLEHQARGGWHAFRRAWATERKMFPMADVMRAGGWTDPKALQRAYSQADAATIRKVAEG